MPTILVIDDNEDFRAYLQTLLERQGYDVVALEGGRNLGQTVQARHIDAVITDLYMPQVDGLEVVTFFNNYDPQLPVFGVTGSEGQGNTVCVRAMNTFGAREVFSKPLDSAQLLAALGRTLKHEADDVQGVLDLGLEDKSNMLIW